MLPVVVTNMSAKVFAVLWYIAAAALAVTLLRCISNPCYPVFADIGIVVVYLFAFGTMCHLILTAQMNWERWGFHDKSLLGALGFS